MKRILLCVFLFTPLLATAQIEEVDELRKSIYFRGGSYYVDDFQTETLHQWLDSIPNLLERYEIQLISHTDPVGGKEYNEWLSQMRSMAVQEILMRRSIPEHKISVKDWGLENAVYRNDSWTGRRLNRRVDVILYPLIF
jgi:outer membrane protein OmpA-like peptidoglycan-associated protein